MSRNTKNLWLIKLALTLAGKKEWKALESSSMDCRKAQFKVLMDILSYAKDTYYGKEHEFSSIRSVGDFQNHVPINDYEDLRPYIMRHTKGEESVLVPGKPVIYATTSGTTKEPKWIPVTKKYFEDCYNGLSKLWLYSLLKENPHIYDGPELSIVGKPVEGYTEDGTPYGSCSGHVYENIPNLLKAVHVVPNAVFSIDDYKSRYYCFMRFTLEYQIKLIVTGNPSTLLALHRVVQENIDNLIKDIEKGSLKNDLKIEPDLRKQIESRLRPNPKRAKELKEMALKHTPLYPKHYWPTLEVVNTWKCGNSGLYLRHAEDFYPENTTVRDFSYFATEARAGIVLTSAQIPSILAAHRMFFEFVKTDDIEDPYPPIYLASELEEGLSYYIIITNTNGLYRYNINDILRVEGFYNEFPMLRFIQKGAGVTSLTGEKLHEAQLIEAFSELERENGIKTAFFIAFASLASSAYHVFIEFEKDVRTDEARSFGIALDNKLMQANIEYKAKRLSLRINPPVLHLLEKNSFEKFKTACLNIGYRDGQFKLCHLLHEDKRLSMFRELSGQTEIRLYENT